MFKYPVYKITSAVLDQRENVWEWGELESCGFCEREEPLTVGMAYTWLLEGNTNLCEKLINSCNTIDIGDSFVLVRTIDNKPMYCIDYEGVLDDRA